MPNRSSNSIFYASLLFFKMMQFKIDKPVIEAKSYIICQLFSFVYFQMQNYNVKICSKVWLCRYKLLYNVPPYYGKFVMISVILTQSTDFTNNIIIITSNIIIMKSVCGKIKQWIYATNIWTPEVIKAVILTEIIWCEMFIGKINK